MGPPRRFFCGPTRLTGGRWRGRAGGAACRRQPPLLAVAGRGRRGRGALQAIALSVCGNFCRRTNPHLEREPSSLFRSHPRGRGRSAAAVRRASRRHRAVGWRGGGEVTSERPSLRAFAVNRFGGRRQSRRRNMPCVFRVRPAREKGGSSRVSAQPPLSRQRGRSILAKEALDPGRRGRSLSAKGALNAPFASLKRKDLPLLPPATLPPTFPHRPEKRGKDWKRAHKKEVFFCRFCEKRPEKNGS